MATPDTEKLSINMGVVDLGQIDLLIEQGFYSNRTDFIRTATRNLLQVHAPVVQQQATARLLGLGVVSYNRADLEGRRGTGKMLDIRLIGLVTLSSDIPPELARSTIKSIKVLGAFRASKAVKDALHDRIEL